MVQDPILWLAVAFVSMLVLIFIEVPIGIAMAIVGVTGVSFIIGWGPALTLLAVTVWLRRSGKRVWYTFVPMLLVLSVTVTALVFQARGLLHARDWVGTINGAVSIVLLALAGTLVFYGARAVRRPQPVAT